MRRLDRSVMRGTRGQPTPPWGEWNDEAEDGSDDDEPLALKFDRLRKADPAYPAAGKRASIGNRRFRSDSIHARPSLGQNQFDRSESLQRILTDENELDVLYEQSEKAQTNEERSWLLFQAIQANEPDLVELLLSQGCALDAVDENQATPLLCAAATGFFDAARMLVDRGSSLSSRDRTGATPLHWAASRGDKRLAKFLLRRGKPGRSSHENPCPVDAKDNIGVTPLHLAASKGHLELVQMLLSRGCPVDVQDNSGRTALHAAAQGGQIDVAKCLLGRGCPVDARDKDGYAPFHSAVSRGEAEVIQLLLDRGFLIQEKTDDGPRIKFALHSLVRMLESQTQNRSAADQRRSRERVLSTLHLLISKGCSCELARSAVWEEKNADVSLVLAAIDGWEVQQKLGMAVSSIPVELLGGSVQDLQFFFKSMKQAGSSYRKKICVVGPSCWGKTSFIKSLTTNTPTLEHEDTRTIGIDLFTWSFDMKGRSGHCEVSLWDFAGQDEYQSAHALFYSKRTLYVVCVNMEAYVGMLQSNNIQEPGENNEAVDVFFDAMIYNRIRAICAREPASEFVFVGTKSDRVKPTWIESVDQDITARFNQRDRDEVYELDRAVEEIAIGRRGQHFSSGSLSIQTETDSKYEHLNLLRRERPKIIFEGLLAMSSADLSGIERVREQLQRCIETSDSSFLMPWNFAMVGQCLRKMVQQAKGSGSIATQVSKVFVAKDKLCELIQKDCAQAELKADEVESILRMLHALGDILWFEKSDGRLSNIVFLSPDLVIDFIRKVVNHQLGNQSSLTEQTASELAVRNDGKVAHSLLAQLELWRDVKDRTVMLQLKRLLFNFQLAYPEGSNMLRWDSDLIVPTYWKQSKRRDSQATWRDIPASLSHTVSWTYEFRTGLPDGLFEKFGVRSYSAYLSSMRSFTRFSFATTRTNEYVAEVSKHAGGSGENPYPSLRIRVLAASMKIAWKQWLWYVVCLERLLDEYPGLWIVRYAVGPDGTKFEVDKLLRERRESNQIRGLADYEQGASSNSDLLPPSMTWFVNKEWNAPEILTDQRSVDAHPSDPAQEPIGTTLERFYEVMTSRFDAGFKALQETVIESASEHARYPGLWSLTRRSNTIATEFELALLSQLSGKCHHPPIIVKVGNTEIFGKHGDKIKMGFSLICSCIPDIPGKGLIEFAASAAQAQVSRSMKAHEIVGQLENVDLSPDQNVRILRELLKLAFDDFDPLKMSEISNLVCGFWNTGRSLWAHKDEIASMGGKITLQNPGAVGMQDSQVPSPGNIPNFPPKVPPKLAPLPPLRPVGDAESSSGPTVAPNELGVTLEIVGAQKLRNVRTFGENSPYCKWKLIDSAHRVLSEGKTPKHVRGRDSAEWEYAKVLRTDRVLTTLAGCTLLFVVKTQKMFSSFSEVIGEGSYTFNEKILPSKGQLSEFDVVLSYSGEISGQLKIRLRY